MVNPMRPKEEEIIDTEQDEKGTYHPIMPYRRPERPNLVAPHLPRQDRTPFMYEFLDGFIIGLEAIERFMRNARRFSRR